MKSKIKETSEIIELLKIVCVGDSNDWKYDVCSKMGESFGRDQQTTIGVITTVTDIIKINNHNVKFSIWDIGSQESFADLRNGYYTGALGAFIVFNATDRSSIDNLEKWVKELREAISGLPIILINNMYDIGEKKPIEDGEIIVKKLSEIINEELLIFEYSKRVDYLLDNVLVTIGKKILSRE